MGAGHGPRACGGSPGLRHGERVWLARLPDPFQGELVTPCSQGGSTPPEQPSDDGAEELVWGTSGLVAAFVSLEAFPRHYALPHASTTAAPSLTRAG
jgi:hypothetical protein